MGGYPYQIEVAEDVFRRAHAHARQVGFHTTSDWLRALLWAWDDEPLNGNAQAEAPAIPAPDNHAGWARAIHDAARRTPHTFSPDKAFIAGVLEKLIERFQPHDPDAFRAQVRALLPVLNRLGLVELTRADLVGSMDPELVRDSAIRYLNAEFHFVALA